MGLDESEECEFYKIMKYSWKLIPQKSIPNGVQKWFQPK